MDTIEAVVPGGQNIIEIMGRDDLPALVWSDGVLIEREQWAVVVPVGHLVIRRIPADRNALRLIGFIALAVFAPGLGPVAASSFGFAGVTSLGATTLAGTLFGAGIGLLGALALNALIPPTFPSIAGVRGPEQLSAITGQSNQVAPWSPIPKVYGNPTYYPPIPMTGLPYTELVGEDQYLRMMVVLGYGPLDIGGHTVGKGHALVTETTVLTGDPIKIGGTSIDQFEDVEFEIGDPDDVTLFTNSVTEATVNVDLDHTTDPTTENQTITDNVQVTQTTEEQTDEVSLDIYFPALFTVSGQGNTRYARVRFQIHYSPASAGSWTLASDFTISSIERKPLRRGQRVRLPSTGQWDIRLTRVSTFYGQENSFFSDCTWTVMRSIKRNVRPFDVDNTVVMALRIRATDQLGGRVDRLSTSVTAVLPIWDGSSWYSAPTRNATWAYVDVLSGNGTKTAASQSSLDATKLLQWANWNTFHGLYFDAVIDAEGTVFDRAREIAASAMASWHVTDDAKYSVIMDEVATPKMVITPRNSFGFSSDYTFHKLPHALRVQFIDPDTWEPTERIVYDDGYTEANATRFEMLPTIGISDPDHAWKFGRYHLAQLRLRPEVYSWGQDVQHLVYQRGDTVRLANDPMLVGLKWGRITAVSSTTEIEVDELLYMEVAETYGLVVQKQDGTIVTQEIDTVSPSTQTVTFTAPVADLNVGDHFAFGELASETILTRITRIEPTGDFKAQITAVPAAENIFDAWSGAIPEFDPVITEPIDLSLLPPVIPTITDIRSESPPSASGAPRNRMVVAFEMPPGLEGVTIEARVRTKEVISSVDVFGDWRILGAADSNSGVIYITEVEEQITYQVQVRSRRGSRISSWSSTGEHTIGDSGWLSEPGSTAGATENSNIAGQIWRSEDFGDGNVDRLEAYIGSNYSNKDGEWSINAMTTPVGAYALRIGNNSGNDEYTGALCPRRAAIPIVTGKLYRMVLIVKQASGTGTLYAGPYGLKGDVRGSGGSLVNGLGLNSWGTQSDFLVAGVNPGSTFVRYEVYFTKDGVAYKTTGGTINDPKVLHPDVEYVIPGFICNYNNVAGIYDFAYWEIQEIAGSDLGDIAVSQQPLTGPNFVNPNFRIPMPGNLGRPAGWWRGNADTDGDPSYLSGTGDVMRVPNNTYCCSSAMRLDPNTAYRVTVRAKGSATMNASLYVLMQEYDSELDIAGGKYAVGANASGESATQDNTRAVVISDTAGDNKFDVTTSYQTFVCDAYYPTSTAKWMSISIHDFNVAGDLHIDQVTIQPLPPVEAEGGSFTWWSNSSGTWPAGNPTQDITINFRRSGVVIATRVLRGTLNSSTGNITLSQISDTGEATSVTPTGSGSATAYYTVTHTGSGHTVRATWASAALNSAGGSPSK